MPLILARLGVACCAKRRFLPNFCSVYFHTPTIIGIQIPSEIFQTQKQTISETKHGSKVKGIRKGQKMKFQKIIKNNICLNNKPGFAFQVIFFIFNPTKRPFRDYFYFFGGFLSKSKQMHPTIIWNLKKVIQKPKKTHQKHPKNTRLNIVCFLSKDFPPI